MSFTYAQCSTCGQVHPEGDCPPTSQELDRQVVRLVNHSTGTLVDLNGSNDHLAEYLQQSKRIREHLRDRERIVEAELLHRMDLQAQYTIHTTVGKLTAPSPQPVEEYDGLALRTDLLEMVDEGLLSVEAVDRACPVEVSVKVSKRGVGQLRKLGGRVAEAVDRHRTEAAPRRSVRVSA